MKIGDILLNEGSAKTDPNRVVMIIGYDSDFIHALSMNGNKVTCCKVGLKEGYMKIIGHQNFDVFEKLYRENCTGV